MQHTLPLTMPLRPPELGGGLAFHPREGSGSYLGQMRASQGNDRGELRPGQAAEPGSGNRGDRMSSVTTRCRTFTLSLSSVDGLSEVQLAFSAWHVSPLPSWSAVPPSGHPALQQSSLFTGLPILWAPREPALCPWPWLGPPILSTNTNPNFSFSSNIHLELKGFGSQTGRCGRHCPTRSPGGNFFCSQAPLYTSLVCCSLVNLDHNTPGGPGSALLKSYTSARLLQEGRPQEPQGRL